MSTTAVVTIIIVVAVVIAFAAALVAMQRRRTTHLRETFGPEYDRTVEQSDKRRDAERELAERKAEHDELEIRQLSPASRARYVEQWEAVQARFVDSPNIALAEADHLVTSLLQERGYPSDDTDSAARMLSVEHTDVLDNFRSGHRIASASQDNSATTEQVRQAMLHFRRVFEDLLHDDRDRAVDLDGELDGDRDRTIDLTEDDATDRDWAKTDGRSPRAMRRQT